MITGFGPSYYDKIFAGSDNYSCVFWESPYYPLWIEVIKRFPIKRFPINEKMKILELGAGTGQFAKMLKHSIFYNYTGVEFSQVGVDIAENVFGIKLICEDIFTWEDWNYDLVIALEVFEHIDDLALIRKIPTGKQLLFTVPNFSYESHLRWFGSIAEVANRYESVIELELIEKAMDRFYIVKGMTR